MVNSLLASCTRRGLMALALALLTGACTEVADESPAVAPSDLLEVALAAEGVDDAVVDCVLRLGADRVAQGPLGEAARDELVASCVEIRAALDGRPGPDDDEGAGALPPPQGPQTFGDDPTLDSLWMECESGRGAACDELFDRAPIGTEYEEFGVSCGRRDELLHCTDLDQPEAG